MLKRMILLDLEEKLLADQSGELRASLQKQLQEMKTRLAGQQRQLHKRERYLEIQSSLQAVTAAIAVFNNLYVGPREPAGKSD